MQEKFERKNFLRVFTKSRVLLFQKKNLKMVVTKRKVDETIKDEEAKDDIVQEKKPRLEGQALLELRQRLRQRKKMFKLMPDFRLKPIGLDARLEIASDLRKRLTMKDLQNLLLYSILGTRAPVEPSRLVNKYKYFSCRGMAELGVPCHCTGTRTDTPNF